MSDMPLPIPPPPEGFVIDAAPGAIPPPPEGFVLDKPTAPVSTGEDVARSLGSGTVQGTAGLIGAAGDAQAALKSHNPFDWLASKIEETFPAYSAYSKDYAAKHRYRSDVGEVALPTSEGVKKTIGDNFGPALEAAGVGRQAKLSDLVTGEGGGFKFYEPQTTAGKYAKTVGEFIPGAVAGPVNGVRQLAGNVARLAIAPGLASEGVSHIPGVEGTPFEGPARIVAGLVAPAAAARAVSPFPNRAPPASAAAHADAVATLRHEGVHVSAGQEADNSRLKFIENDLNPEAGKEMLEGFTRAATRAGGAEAPVLIHGRGGTVDNLLAEVGGRFDRLQAANTLRVDPRLALDLLRTHDEYTRVPGLFNEATINSVRGVMGRIGDVIRSGTASGRGATMSGGEYQTLTSDLRRAARGTADPQQAEAIHDVIDHLDNAMERSIARHNPGDAGEFGRARGDYKRALVLERAATAAGESPARGYVTPAQLERSAKAVYRARAYERGQTPFSDLGQAGAAVLKALPDSGTSQRVRIDNAIGVMTGAAGAGLGFHFGGGFGAAEGGVAGLLTGREAIAPIVEPAVRAALRAGLLNEPVQRYLGNQAAAGLPRLRDTPQGLLTAIEAVRQ